MNSTNNSSKSNKPSPLYHSLINQWKQEFFIGRKFYFQRQYRDKFRGTLVYHYVDKKGEHSAKFDDSVWMNNSVLDNHFLVDGQICGKNWIGGSIAVRPCFETDSLRWVCFDLDEEESVKKFMDKVAPRLQELGIQFMEELGGDNDERRHIWIKLDCTQLEAKNFFTRLFMEIFNHSEGDPFIKEGFNEIFGVNKVSNVVRVPLGWHLRRDKRSPILRQDGTPTLDPGEFFQEWIDLKTLGPEDLIRLGKLIKAPDIKEKKEASLPLEREIFGDHFCYAPINLPMNMPEVPSTLMPVYRNCQAIHEIIDEVMHDNMIARRGELHHSAGLYLSGIAAYCDGVDSKKSKSEEGLKWFKSLVTNYRKRDDAETHNWDYKYRDAQLNPNRYFPKCSTWQEKFDKCAGCPFEGRIHSPTQFIYGKQMTKSMSPATIKLKTPDQIRNTTFVEAKDHILKVLSQGEEDNILLASPMGSGKSFFVDQVACELARGGYKVLIACPTVKLSKEHKERIEACGEHAFILASHKGIFKEELVNFECPSMEEITKGIDLGEPRSIIKNNFCQSCPLRDDCFFPNQYKEVMEDKHKIVLIQHAHMATPEILYELMKKKFDVMFIDETFINMVFKETAITQKEIDLLDCLNVFPWAERLVNWLNGERPLGTLMPPGYELEKVRGVFSSADLPWRVPELIRLYNSKNKVDLDRGVIQSIYSLPDIPVKIFTDATPPEELIKELTGIKELTVFGKEEILDIKAIHPDNKIIQLINNSTSVTALKNEAKFEAIVLQILELAENYYTTESILVTLYKNDIPKFNKVVEKYKAEYPDTMNKITLDWMSKGTNKYEDFDVQFLLCGLYPAGGDLKSETYKFKEVSNYYRTKRGEELIPNSYEEGPRLSSYGRRKVPITRYEYGPRSKPILAEYKGLTIFNPSGEWHEYIYKLNVANTQQAIRLRFNPNKKREIYLLNNFFYPSLIISDSILLEDFIKSYVLKG